MPIYIGTYHIATDDDEWMNDHDFLLWINRWYGRRPWRRAKAGHQTHCWQGGWKRRGGAWQNNWGGEQFLTRHWITYCRKLKISARLHNYYLEKLDKLLLLCLKHVIQFLNTLYPLQILEKIHNASENSAIKFTLWH